MQQGLVYYVLRDARQISFCVSGHLCKKSSKRPGTSGQLTPGFAAAPSSQDKDESGFASIDELDPKGAKAITCFDLEIVGREDCRLGNPRFEFPFGTVDGDNPGKSVGVSWGS